MAALPPLAVQMMTLSALAATAPNPRPSGESIADQEARILAGINSQLTQLGSSWVANWLVLTADLANLAYIATEASTSSFAVVLRGTQFNSLVDLAEDMNVGALAQLTAAGDNPVLISLGTMNAFTEIANAVSSTGTTMLAELTAQLAALPEGTTPNLYVTGHSLGGCMATVVALYLEAQSWATAPNFNVYTFAAPTAGLQPFADLYDQIFPDTSWRVYNRWDVVPNAWASLDDVIEHFYPAPGPAQSIAVHQLLLQVAKATANNVYVQTNKDAGTSVLNDPFYAEGTYDQNATCPTTGDFFAQLAFQHANDTYLALLGAPPVPDIVPKVTGITPNCGPVAGGTPVTVYGSDFVDGSSLVDFGTVPVPAANVTFVSATELTVTSSPAVVGTVDVRVTTPGGTSAASPADQFTAPAPTATPEVTPVSPYEGQYPPASPPPPSAIAPNGGPRAGGTKVTVYGTGFVTDPDCVVMFGSEKGRDVTIVSLTELTVVSPAAPRNLQSPTVDVTVTNTNGTSATSSADQFTYGLPLVTKIDPCCGPANPKDKQPIPFVTVQGAGFTKESMVTFGQEGPAATCTYESDTKLTVTPPSVKIVGGIKDVPVDVTVTNPTVGGGTVTSPLTPEDVYTFCPS